MPGGERDFKGGLRCALVAATVKTALFNQPYFSYLGSISTLKEIEAIPKLSRAEIEQIRDWIDDYLEDQLEVTNDVKSKLDQSRREIESGQYTARQSK